MGRASGYKNFQLLDIGPTQGTPVVDQGTVSLPPLVKPPPTRPGSIWTMVSRETLQIEATHTQKSYKFVTKALPVTLMVVLRADE